MDPRLTAALRLCGSSERLLVLCPFRLAAEDRAALEADVRVVRLSEGEGDTLFGRARGATVPRGARRLVYAGFRRRLSTAQLLAARRAGCRRVVWRTGAGWRDARIDIALLTRALAVGRGRVSALADRLPRWARPPLGPTRFRELARIGSRRPDRGPLEARRLRVVLVTGSLAAGGAERQAAQAARVLAATGRMEVILSSDALPADAGSAFFLPLTGDGVRIAEVGAAGAGSTPEMSESARTLLGAAPPDLSDAVAELLADFDGQRPDVVHAWQDAINVRAGMAAVLAGVPRIVLSTRNVRPTRFAYHRDYMRAAYLTLAARPNVVLLGNSEAGASDYADWLGLPARRFQVVPNGVDPSLFPRPTDAERARGRAELGIGATAPVLGGVFGLRPEKRPLLWLAAARHVCASRPETHLVVVGGGAMRRRFESAAERVGLAGRLHLVSDPADPAPLLSLMDVCLLTSRHEGLPNVLLEAQLLGLPVVTTAAGGASEAVLEGESGWVVRGSDPRELAARVLWLLGDEAARRRAASAGPAFVRTRFSLERMTEGLLAAYGLA